MTSGRKFSALAAMVVLAFFASSGPVVHAAAAPAPQPTCHGQKATIVGSKLARITGTPGRDVIVTNGAERVTPLAGDDLVCGTGGGPYSLYVKDGPGDDVYDLRGWNGLRGRGTSAILRAGDDTVRTGPGPDSVEVAGYGRDRIFVGMGQDRVELKGHAWAERDLVDLGPGADHLTLGLAPGAVPRLKGGDGFDSMTIVGRSTKHWVINASAREVVEVPPGAGLVPAAGFRHFHLQTMRVPAIAFFGTDRSEHLQFGLNHGAASRYVSGEIPVPSRSLDIETRGGDDTLFLGSNDTGLVDGGAGVDQLHVIADQFDSGAEADLLTGEVWVADDGDEPHLLKVMGIANLTMTAFFPLFLGGDDSANVLTASNCIHPQTIEGRGGDDTLVLSGSTYDITGCDTVYEEYSPGTLRGGDGDDVLIGDVNDDTIAGDEGYDTADGYGGNDTCSAEVVTNCGGGAP
jgi:Ca2+-binding RTX toxin-like protein